MPANLTNIRRKNRELLNTAGLRNTSQRALILEIIKQGQGHLDADELYRLAREQQHRISLSTVYRTLQKLKELGLIKELHFDETHHHYEIQPSTEHHHLVCLGCGKVFEFKCPLSQKIKEDISLETGFTITNTEVKMTGYCPSCNQKKNEHICN